MSWDIQPNKQSDPTFHAEWGLLFRVGNPGKAESISQTVVSVSMKRSIGAFHVSGSESGSWMTILQLSPAQVRAAPPPPTQNHRRPAEKMEDVEITLVWQWVYLLLLLQSRPGLEFGQSFLGTFAWWWLLNRTKPRRILCDWLAWLCLFVVIFYVISPTIAQTIAGPRCRGEQLSWLMVAHFYMRLKARPRSRAQSQNYCSCALTCTVYYCSHKAVAKISSVFKWTLLFWLSINQIMLTI